jgi:hypothetical protein
MFKAPPLIIFQKGLQKLIFEKKNIKRFLYREHFYPDLDQASGEFDYLQSHAGEFSMIKRFTALLYFGYLELIYVLDHCLDFLRQGIMCHLDYSMYNQVDKLFVTCLTRSRFFNSNKSTKNNYNLIKFYIVYNWTKNINNLFFPDKNYYKS